MLSINYLVFLGNLRGCAVGLTLRQKAFLSRSLDLYRELRRPFHYSEVAPKLGISSLTAYDMLRVLEEKGLVRSQYVLKKNPGPGRSSILFSPTEKAEVLFHRLAGDAVEKEEWEEVKARVIAELHRAEDCDYNELMRVLLSQTEEVRSPLAFCGQIITALLLGLRVLRHRPGEHHPIATMSKIPSSRLGLGMLAGMALGIVQYDRACRQLFGNFQGPMEKFETSLQQLPPEKVEQLHDFTREVATTLRVGADQSCPTGGDSM